MRITNKMMTNNMMSNINKNKLNMNGLEQQYSTGKKIQKPSDDPIIAVRALKLRTNLSELNQYYEKNIPDAKSWMEVTEGALTTVNDVLKQINTSCVQGSTDTLTAQDRSAIVENLEQMKQQIYQEGNTNYAGRYVFTGYKTDVPLIFNEDEKTLTYTINEGIAGDKIQTVNKVFGSYEMKDYDSGSDFAQAPQINQCYRIQLSYNELSDTPPNGIHVFNKNASGELEEQSGIDASNIAYIPVTDPDAYSPLPGEVHYIPETGEMILGSTIYDTLRTADKLEITYTKTGFESGDLRPEHYFNCTMTDSSKPEQDEIKYKKEKQDIQYEINYNQKITINTEGSDAISHQMGRQIDDILNAVNDVLATEKKIEEVDKRLEDSTLGEEDIARYKQFKEQLNTELVLKKEVMQQSFEKGNDTSTEEQDRVNIAVADLGSRSVRLDLTENRLSSQQVDFEDLLSKNEDADMTDTYIRYSSAEMVYNSSLSAAAKIVQHSLLDFL